MADQERYPHMAGAWYPGDEQMLRHDVQQYVDFEQLTTRTPAPRALLAPHAGYVYSGSVAGKAYGALFGHQYERVVVISPSHRDAFTGMSIYEGAAYHTPLGRITVDQEMAIKLADQLPSGFLGLDGHREEHALELQLPFLQVMLESFRLIPIVMGSQSRTVCEELAQGLTKVLPDEGTLVVASSDLSHFHSHQAAEHLDHRFRDLFQAADPRLLAEALQEGSVEACGGGPVVAAMSYNLARGGRWFNALKYQDSSAVNGDESSVVGYLAGVMA